MWPARTRSGARKLWRAARVVYGSGAFDGSGGRLFFLPARAVPDDGNRESESALGTRRPPGSQDHEQQRHKVGASGPGRVHGQYQPPRR